MLDAIRGTNVQAGEAGAITQSIGASLVPAETIRKISSDLLRKFRVEVKVPGLLFVDTPGHESFVSLRRRGSSIANLAVLVIDLHEGFKPQTDESLKLLQEFKVPFVVAATKIDKLQDWVAHPKQSFLQSLAKQKESVRNELEKKVYSLISQLAERGLAARRFDRVEDFTKEVSIVPCSGLTGEGIPELLLVLAGIAQKFLSSELELGKEGKGSILEVKETRGLGVTVDALLYDGELKVGDFLVIGSRKPLVTKVRSLLLPRPLQELRVEKKFRRVEKVCAACGVRIAAPGLEEVVAGSPFVVCSGENEVEKARKELIQEVRAVEFSKEIDGVMLKSDTLGGLEALIELAKKESVPIRKAEVGDVRRSDLVELQNVKKEVRALLLFNAKISKELATLAKDLRVRVFQGNIIYKLLEEFKEWQTEERQRQRREMLEKIVWPAKLRLLPGTVFRQSRPAIFGVEVLSGRIRPGYALLRKDGKSVGRIKEIQREGKPLPEALKGERIAISVEEIVVGRTLKEGEVFYTNPSLQDIQTLTEKFRELLEEDDLTTVEEIKKLLKSH